MDNLLDLKEIYNVYSRISPYQKIGKIISANATAMETNLPKAPLGALVEFITESDESSLGEVIAIKKNSCIVTPYHDLSSTSNETLVYLKDNVNFVKISSKLLGRVVDSLGNPLDGLGEITGPYFSYELKGRPTNPLERELITEHLDVGINSINAFCTLAKGQRMAILAGSGVGKSVLLGMMAKNTTADINVITLVGERGREVLEFIKHNLTPESLKKSVIICETSEKSPLLKMRAAYYALAVAEYFRDQKNDVLLMMDSITRFAMAARELALAIGEPPGTKGYTPSVFARLPRILERCGRNKLGSITGLFTVLVEGSDFDEPITDAIKAISDGHIVLNRDLANKNHYPAIDILFSISRTMGQVVSKEFKVVSNYLRELLSNYREMEDLINVGAYSKGSNRKVDQAIHVYDDLAALLKQDQTFDQCIPWSDVYESMVNIVRKAEGVA